MFPAVEKVLYALWRDEGMAPAELSRRLRGPVADALFRGGARGLQVNIADDDVAGALIRLAHIGPSPDALVGLWLDSVLMQRTLGAGANRPPERPAP